MIIHGQLLRVEPVQGTSNGESYSYLRAHILDGVQVVSARVGDKFGPLPDQGQPITANCYVSAYKGRDGARLSVVLDSPVRDVSHLKSA